jgi:hypothetical protein
VTGFGLECRHGHRQPLWLGLFGLLFAGTIMPAVAQEPPGRVVVVLDSSIAMQSVLGNESKLDAAKNALGMLLQRFDGKLDLGLTAYGAKKAKACRDVALLSPPQPLKAAKIARPIAALRPVGAAPLALAIGEAATALGPAGARDRLLLVTGGPDGCEADPCAIARQAKAERQIKIDVVAIRGAGEDLKPLRCIAKLSGGAYFEVTNAARLTAALDKVLSQVAGVQVATPEASGEAATATLSEAGDAGPGPLTLSPESEGLGEAGEETPAMSSLLPVEDPDNAITADGKVPTLFLALLADPGPQIDSGLTWRIYERKAGDDGLHKLVAKSEDAAPRLPLAPGDYMVNVAYGRAYLTRSVRVEATRPTRERFVLNAGGLRLSARTVDGQAIASGAVVNDIYSDERDQSGNRGVVVSAVKPGVIVRLNAGIYHVRSTYGDANGLVQGDISIEAGRLTEMTLTHEASNVTLKLVAQSGGEALADTQWRIFTPDGTLVRESVGALPTHILAPGRYTGEALRGGQKYAEVFEVSPGTPRTVEVVLPAE